MYNSGTVGGEMHVVGSQSVKKMKDEEATIHGFCPCFYYSLTGFPACTSTMELKG